MNYCKTCKHWEKVNTNTNSYMRHTKGYLAGGFCSSEDNIIEGYPDEEFPPDALIYTYQEGGAFWTGPDFGCVHHEPKP